MLVTHRMIEAEAKLLTLGCVTGQAKDLNKLMVPGRRSSTTLKREGEDATGGNNLSLDVPVNMFSKDSIKKLTGKKESEDKLGKKQPVIVKTESETKKPEAPSVTKVVKAEAGMKKPEAPAATKVAKAEFEARKPETKVTKEDAKVQQKEAPVIDRSLKTKEQPMPRPAAPVPQIEGGILKPSQVKSSGFLPTNNQQKPQEKPSAPSKNKLVNDFPIIQTPPPAAPSAQRRALEHERRPAPGRLQQVKQQEHLPQQTFTGTADLENMDFVRRPSRPPPQDNNASNTPPAITVIPSTPKPSDVPIPSSPTHDIIVQKASVNTPAVSQMKEKPKSAELSASEAQESKSKPDEAKVKPAEPKDKPNEAKVKPAEPKEKPKEKLPAPKAPAEKTQDQKPSTPPAATFQSNASSPPDEPLIAAEPKKGGWL